MKPYYIYKTITAANSDQFDEMLNDHIRDGWEIDSFRVGQDTLGLTYIVFLYKLVTPK